MTFKSSHQFAEPISQLCMHHFTHPDIYLSPEACVSKRTPPPAHKHVWSPPMSASIFLVIWQISQLHGVPVVHGFLLLGIQLQSVFPAASIVCTSQNLMLSPHLFTTHTAVVKVLDT